MRTSEFIENGEFKRNKALSFEGNNALARFLGCRWDPASKRWKLASSETKDLLVQDVLDGFAVIEEGEEVIFVVDYDNRFLAGKHEFTWNTVQKLWVKTTYKPLPECASVNFAEFKIGKEHEVNNRMLEKVGVETPLYEFQLRAVAKMSANTHCYNASEMGNGKSLITIASYLHTSRGSKLLVICPASLKYNWRAEFLKHTSSIKSEDIEVVNSTFKTHDKTVTIINYDVLEKNLAALLDYGFDFLVADEFHYAKNPKAKRTAAFMKLAAEADRVHLLSGTPSGGKATDLYTATQVLELEEYAGFSFNRFAEQHCYEQERTFNGHKVKQFFGLKNEGFLRAQMYPKFLRFEAKEVALPEQIHTDMPVIISGKEKKELMTLIKESGLNKKNLEKAESLEELLEGVAIATIKAKIALVKAKTTAETAIDLLEDNEESIVIYSDHRDSAAAIAQALEKAKIAVAEINGSTNNEERQNIVDKFQQGTIRVIVGTSALATGLTLTRANIMIINDSSYNVATNVQLYKRIHRIGQINRCNYYHMTLELDDVFPIDRVINKIIKTKAEIMQKLVETKEEKSHDDL